MVLTENFHDRIDALFGERHISPKSMDKPLTAQSSEPIPHSIAGEIYAIENAKCGHKRERSEVNQHSANHRDDRPFEESEGNQKCVFVVQKESTHRGDIHISIIQCGVYSFR